MFEKIILISLNYLIGEGKKSRGQSGRGEEDNYYYSGYMLQVKQIGFPKELDL